ncbi:MAG: flagellar hook-basal body complex protein FliE [Pseudomonadota bacterium]
MTFESAIATQLYGTMRQATDASAGAGPMGAGDAPGESFSQALAEAARALEGTLRRGESTATAVVSGSGDMQSLVEAMTAAEMAVETVVVMRDRVVEAYQEILRMPV